MLKFFKKYHKWVGLPLVLFLIVFAFSGIVLNHRKTFSSIDLNRKVLSKDYRYQNWNNAAVAGTLKLSSDSILIYGNIGIWLTDSLMQDYARFGKGFGNGVDKHKIYKVFKGPKGKIYAGSYFGLYQYQPRSNQWRYIHLDVHNERIADIASRGDSLLVLTRSELMVTTDGESFERFELPAPSGYDGRVGLFKTLWIIHSGEIYGLAGKLFVDAVALIFIFLSVSGFILFLNPYVIKRRKAKNRNFKPVVQSSRWNLKWHNKLGWMATLFLVITALTGMFLRPPLLIPIANAEVSKIPFTILDTPNPWFDKLRRIIYDPNRDTFIFGSPDGVYFCDASLKSPSWRIQSQPPISVMGISVFEQLSKTELLIGSFSGLFHWDMAKGDIINYITKQPYVRQNRSGPPIGEHSVTAFSRDFTGGEHYFDYGRGVQTLSGNERFPEMPEEIQNEPISLWNFALEVHTARIFSSLIGPFYILIVPLTGFLSLFVVISGFVLWFKRHRKKY